MPDLYETEENTLVAINTNYAIGADLNPSEDALILEGDESPYVNVVAVRKEDKDNETLNTLVDVLHSDKIQEFIKEELVVQSFQLMEHLNKKIHCANFRESAVYIRNWRQV